MASCVVCIKAIGLKKPKWNDSERDFLGSCLKMSKADDVACITANWMTWRCQPCAETRRQSLRFEFEEAKY